MFNYLLHDHILAFTDELALCFDDRLQKVHVLDVSAVRLDAVNKVLDHLVAQFAA